MDRIKLFSDSISDLLGINVFYFSRKTIASSRAHNSGPEFIEKIKEEILNCITPDNYFSHFSTVSINRFERIFFAKVAKPFSLTIGPFFLSDLDRESTVKYYLNAENEVFAEGFAKVKTMTLGNVYSLDLLFASLASSDEENTRPDNEEDFYSGIDDSRYKIVFERDVISKAYKAERLLRQCIMNGNKKTALQILSGMNNDSQNYDGRNYKDIREARRYGLTLNTIFRLSAEQAGLPDVKLHAISHSFGTKIKTAQNILELESVIRQMTVTYCEAVEENSMSLNSFAIKNAKKMILENLDRNFTLDELADEVHMNRSYLSRLFREECGMTITEFTKKNKISKAKWLLENTDFSITEISESLGFEYETYFSNVFCKAVGMSPSRYKKKLGSGKIKLTSQF